METAFSQRMKSNDGTAVSYQEQEDSSIFSVSFGSTK